MMRKQMIFPIALLLIVSIGGVYGQDNGNCVTESILTGYSNRNFIEGPVSDQQIDLILQCGIKAPSARNTQLWKFTVVKNDGLLNEIVADLTPGNVLIVVSGQETEQPGIDVDFDCALATENMFLAAESVGLGAHILGSPVGNINSSMKEALGIPGDYRAIAVLRIGRIDESVDAVSAASARKSLEEIVTYR